jgi:hypothetical protein
LLELEKYGLLDNPISNKQIKPMPSVQHSAIRGALWPPSGDGFCPNKDKE